MVITRIIKTNLKLKYKKIKANDDMLIHTYIGIQRYIGKQRKQE